MPRNPCMIRISWNKNESDGGSVTVPAQQSRKEALVCVATSKRFRKFRKAAPRKLHIEFVGGRDEDNNNDNNDNDDNNNTNIWKPWRETIQKKVTVTVLSLSVKGHMENGVDRLGWKALHAFECLPNLEELTLEGNIPLAYSILNSIIKNSLKLKTLNLRAHLVGDEASEATLLPTLAGHQSLEKCELFLPALFQRGRVLLDSAKRHDCSNILKGLGQTPKLWLLRILRGSKSDFDSVSDFNWHNLLRSKTITHLTVTYITTTVMQVIETNDRLQCLYIGQLKYVFLPPQRRSELRILSGNQHRILLNDGGNNNEANVSSSDESDESSDESEVVRVNNELDNALGSFLASTTHLRSLTVGFVDRGISTGVKKGLLCNKSLQCFCCIFSKISGWEEPMDELLRIIETMVQQKSSQLHAVLLFDRHNNCFHPLTETIRTYCKINQYRDEWIQFSENPKEHFQTFMEVSKDFNLLFHLTKEAPSFFIQNQAVFHSNEKRFRRNKKQQEREEKKRIRKEGKRKKKKAKKELKRKRDAFEASLQQVASIGSETLAILDDRTKTIEEKNRALKMAYKKARVALK